MKLPILNRARDLVELSELQMKILVTFADVVERGHLRIQLICPDCETPLRGSNTGWEQTLSMQCLCREYRGRNPLPEAARPPKPSAPSAPIM